MKLFFNGTILTMEEKCYTEAILVNKDEIYAMGKYEDLLNLCSEKSEFVDLQGKTMMPSFIDAHSHFSAYANSLLQIPLEEATSFAEIQREIEKFIKRNNSSKGEWIVAKGYDHNSLTEKTHPKKEILDKVCPENPLMLQHRSGHVGVFNTQALKTLGVTNKTLSPIGGVIEVKDETLTGYMEESAFIQYQKKIPMTSVKTLMESYKKTQDVYAANGITTMQDGMVVTQMLPLYQALLEAELLKLDLVAYVDIKDGEQILEAFPKSSNKYEKHLKIGGYKIILDGSPQGRTAWMRTPYLDEADYCGYGTLTDEDVYEAVKKAKSDNLQLLAHCNGDAACEQYISACEKVSNNSLSAIRPVMIHAQLLGTDQLKRLAAIPIIPSFFMAHVYYWGDVHIANFGKERAQHISPAKSALNEGILFTFHQDSPVIDPNMLETIRCAVTRKTKAGIVLGESEKIYIWEALKAVTINAAYQYFEEEKKGSIAPGKQADLVVLSQNPLETAPDLISDIIVLKTYKGGELVYERKGLGV